VAGAPDQRRLAVPYRSQLEHLVDLARQRLAANETLQVFAHQLPGALAAARCAAGVCAA
jgi:hypothetical protein